MSSPLDPAAARALIVEGIGRRAFLRAATAVTAVTVGSPLLGASPALAAPASAPAEPLQPGSGLIHGDHYLPSTPDDVRWGYVPGVVHADVGLIVAEQAVPGLLAPFLQVAQPPVAEGTPVSG